MSVWWMVLLGWLLGSFPLAVLMGKMLASGRRTPPIVETAAPAAAPPLPSALPAALPV